MSNDIDALRVRVAELAANPDADALERIEAQEQLIAALDNLLRYYRWMRESPVYRNDEE